MSGAEIVKAGRERYRNIQRLGLSFQIFRTLPVLKKIGIERKYAIKALRISNSIKDVSDQDKKLDYLIFVDLTTPEFVSERLKNPELRDSTIEDFREAVSEFFRRLYADKFPNGSGEFAPMRTIHTWSSSHQTEPHLHTHTVIPNVAIQTIKQEWKNICGREQVLLS